MTPAVSAARVGYLVNPLSNFNFVIPFKIIPLSPIASSSRFPCLLRRRVSAEVRLGASQVLARGSRWLVGLNCA
eukprot:5507974-Karenia_brevis.AAC.1